MNIPLKDFQEIRSTELREKFDLTRQNLSEYESVLLAAPTGSGKTMMATSFIEGLLAGNETDGMFGDPAYVVLWLTDQLELNQQTYDKMVATSSVLNDKDLLIIDAGFDAERLSAGKVYFLNTQKLGSATTFVKHGDDRQWTLWETLINTLEADPAHFVLVLDEAHRGARGKEAEEAETIMQRFVKGDAMMPKMPLIVGISATPDRFVQLCGSVGRPVRQVIVTPDEVRVSGLLKDWVDYYHPNETGPSDVTMLLQAIEAWKGYDEAWTAYPYSVGDQPVRPVLLVQVRDKTPKSKELSATDLEMVVRNLEKHVAHEEGDNSWLAHAFQDEGDNKIDGKVVRHLAPSRVDADPDVRVVLFKTSLNTGWDCPRAEVMVSFRPATDPTNIAQLVGRMVRTPLARRVAANEHLNTVSLYLPHYNRAAVQKVIAYLQASDDEGVATGFREGKQAVMLTADSAKEACFDRLRKLPTDRIPSRRPMRPVPRLAKLAALLGQLGWETDPVKVYRQALVGILLDQRTKLAKDTTFAEQVEQQRVLDVRRKRVAYVSNGDGEGDEEILQVPIADKNVDDLYAEAGRMLGEGLQIEYLRARGEQYKAMVQEMDAIAVKVELHVLVTTPGVVDKVNAKAEELRVAWMDAHKAAIDGADEKARDLWDDIEGSGGSPWVDFVKPPSIIEVRSGSKSWPLHVYVDANGEYHEDLKSSWETRAISAALDEAGVVGWLRNFDRKPWSLRVKRREGTKWVGIYPDFIVFRQTKGGVVADVIDPHLLDDDAAPARAQALAEFVQDHVTAFGRFELIIYKDKNDELGKSLNLLDEKVRGEVAKVDSAAYLRHLFESQ